MATSYSPPTANEKSCAWGIVGKVAPGCFETDTYGKMEDNSSRRPGGSRVLTIASEESAL